MNPGPDPRWRDVAAILLGPLVPKLRSGGETPVTVAVPVTAPAAPHAAAPVGAAGHQQPGAREIGRSSPRGAGSAGTRESARPVSTTAGSCGNTGQPPEWAGVEPGLRGCGRTEVPGDAPAPPIDYEPRWFCPTCDDGHIGPCDAGTPRRRPMLLRLLDLIGRPA